MLTHSSWREERENATLKAATLSILRFAARSQQPSPPLPSFFFLLTVFFIFFATPVQLSQPTTQQTFLHIAILFLSHVSVSLLQMSIAAVNRARMTATRTNQEHMSSSSIISAISRRRFYSVPPWEIFAG